ncbi:MAG: BON domain-containing protein [Balneolaceae bacterium]|nr:BON domain-containing protein [Balneolaceae bacterium]
MKLPGFAENFSLSKLLALLFSFIFIIAVGSCTQEESPSEVAQLPSDQEITKTIRAQLTSSDQIPADSINIDTKDGVVMLSGNTTNLLAKKEAKKIAQAIYGVLSVVNNLKITTTRPDQAVNDDIDQALSSDPATETWKISTSVNNGVVTLKGAVDSWQEAQLAATIASGVKGVKEVNNNIIVNYEGARTDEEIKAEIQTRLKMNSQVNANMVNVDVNEGTVSLTGAISSAYEKSLATDLARVTGVETVEVDELQVHPEYESKMFQNSSIESLTNSQIKTAITSAFRYDPRVPEDNITVSIDGGTAILQGSVLNLSSKLAAENDALNTAGVNTVKNNITVERKVMVEPEVPTTDEAIAQRLRYAINRDPYVEQTELTVEVNKGIAVLKGQLDSQFEKSKLLKIAQNVKGIIAIKNDITVPSANS